MPTGSNEYVPARTPPENVSRLFNYILDRKTKVFICLKSSCIKEQLTYIKRLILEA